MTVNPYSPPEIASAATLPENRTHWFADAIFAAFASYGLSHLALLITALLFIAVSFAFYGQPFGLRMVALHVVIAFVSVIVAATIFGAVSMRRFTCKRWVPPATYVTGTFCVSFIIYTFTLLNDGLFDLSSFFCICLIALSPLIVWLSLVRFSTRGLVWSTIPYLCVLLAIVYAAWTDER